MRPYLITAKLMRPSNMKRFPNPGLDLFACLGLPVRRIDPSISRVAVVEYFPRDSVGWHS
jgi:hypothetical protein